MEFIRRNRDRLGGASRYDPADDRKRIKRLPEEARDLLSIAALIGKTFEFRDLEALVDEDTDPDDALERLLQEGFIQEERVGHVDRFSFSSAVVRDVLYAALSRRKRKILHRKYAEHLEKIHSGQLERVYSQLVHYYSNADMPAKAIEYGLKAAERSLDAFSGEDAIRSAKLVLGFLQNTSGSERLLEAQASSFLARANRLMSNFEEAVGYWKKVIAILEQEKAGTVEAFLSAAETAWEGRKVDEARLFVEKGVDAARVR